MSAASAPARLMVGRGPSVVAVAEHVMGCSGLSWGLVVGAVFGSVAARSRAVQRRAAVRAWHRRPSVGAGRTIAVGAADCRTHRLAAGVFGCLNQSIAGSC